MRKSLMMASLISLLGATPALAMQCPNMVGKSTKIQCTESVFNDSGSDLTSGAVVVWDNDDTEFDRTGHRYVTTTTTADHDHPAGVVKDDTCQDQTMCEIVVYGWARTNIAHSTDAVAEDTQVATSTVAGQAGDWGAGANTCSLGMLLEVYSLENETTDVGSADLTPMPVFVRPGCED